MPTSEIFNRLILVCLGATIGVLVVGVSQRAVEFVPVCIVILFLLFVLESRFKDIERQKRGD